MQTIPQFLLTLAAAQVEVEKATHRALEKAARVVEREAKAEIGEYQGQAGPFVAWAELAQSTKDDRVRNGFAENEPLLRTGDLRDSIGHTVHMHDPQSGEATVGSNSDIAVYQELGTRHIPPRSFLGGALVRKTNEVKAICGQEVVRALVGDSVAGKVMQLP